jgi:hypothetical protein
MPAQPGSMAPTVARGPSAAATAAGRRATAMRSATNATAASITRTPRAIHQGRDKRKAMNAIVAATMQSMRIPELPAAQPLQLLGVDFTSAPSRRKPITVARGTLSGARLALQRIERLETFAAFEALLVEPGPWLGGFDFPFGLPRELVEALDWPRDFRALIAHDRAVVREVFAAFCAARPAGSKFAHRACDRPAGSSPSMKWVNPPVAYMLHAGVPRLIDAGVDLPALLGGDRKRVALEAYPGLLARELIGARSYKSDDRAKQTSERLIARKDLLHALELGQTRLGLRVALTAAQRDALAADAQGDLIDALLCLVQAAWASTQPNWGLPAAVDPIEGWIVSA